MKQVVRSNFKLQDALLMQQDQLQMWKTILNEQAYRALSNACARANTRLPADASGVDVWQGKHLTEAIERYAISLTHWKRVWGLEPDIEPWIRPELVPTQNP